MTTWAAPAKTCVELGVLDRRDRRRRCCRPARGAPAGRPAASAASWPTIAGDRLDLDLDEVAGVLGDVAGLGDDERDRLAGEAHVAVGEQPERPAAVAALEVDPRLDDVAVEVGAGEHGDDAGQLAGRADVERRDRAAGDVAADERDVQQPGHDDVVDVAAVAGQQAGVLAPLHPLADEAVPGRCTRHRPRSSPSPPMRDTALTMPW